MIWNPMIAQDEMRDGKVNKPLKRLLILESSQGAAHTSHPASAYAP